MFGARLTALCLRSQLGGPQVPGALQRPTVRDRKPATRVSARAYSAPPVLTSAMPDRLGRVAGRDLSVRIAFNRGLSLVKTGSMHRCLTFLSAQLRSFRARRHPALVLQERL